MEKVKTNPIDLDASIAADLRTIRFYLILITQETLFNYNKQFDILISQEQINDKYQLKIHNLTNAVAFSLSLRGKLGDKFLSSTILPRFDISEKGAPAQQMVYEFKNKAELATFLSLFRDLLRNSPGLTFDSQQSLERRSPSLVKRFRQSFDVVSGAFSSLFVSTPSSLEQDKNSLAFTLALNGKESYNFVLIKAYLVIKLLTAPFITYLEQNPTLELNSQVKARIELAQELMESIKLFLVKQFLRKPSNLSPDDIASAQNLITRANVQYQNFWQTFKPNTPQANLDLDTFSQLLIAQLKKISDSRPETAESFFDWINTLVTEKKATVSEPSIRIDVSQAFEEYRKSTEILLELDKFTQVKEKSAPTEQTDKQKEKTMEEQFKNLATTRSRRYGKPT